MTEANAHDPHLTMRLGERELVIRPAIRLSRQIHLRRMHPARGPRSATETVWDF